MQVSNMTRPRREADAERRAVSISRSHSRVGVRACVVSSSVEHLHVLLFVCRMLQFEFGGLDGGGW